MLVVLLFASGGDTLTAFALSEATVSQSGALAPYQVYPCGLR